MYFNTEFDNVGFSEHLPVFHIFYPTTFAKIVSSFLETKGIDSCWIVGQRELRVLKPVKTSTSTSVPSPWVTESPLSFFSEEDEEDRAKSQSSSTKSTSKSRSKRKLEPGGDRGPLSTSSAAAPPPRLEELAQNSQPQSSSSSSGNGDPCRTFAVNILGVSDNPVFRGGDDGGADYALEIIGRCSKSNVKISTNSRGSGLMLDFQIESGSGRGSPPQVSLEMVRWHNQRFYPDPNHLLLFEYDPLEFQQWKYPQSGGSAYPLGIPKVFVEGMSHLHTSQSFGFTPVLPIVNPDHQDLNACDTTPPFFTSNSLFSFISRKSAGLEQIFHKVSILVEGLLGNYALLPFLNFLLLLLIDSLIGYVVTSYLLPFPNLLEFLHEGVDQMLVHLNHLLKWLHGAPAGLKLNHNLNSLYWRFFSYHIHLWASYIGILEPIFAVILNTIQYMGGLGVTIQLSLLKDLINLATFHVYCLYIYATRLYSIQTTAIAALCRVFFGRKYNPLRDRFDSVQLNTSELFISSFGFVILIFLFPTTFVYYVGFVCLRVPVFLTERVLQYVVTTFNKLPIISWALVLINSPRVADEVYILPRLGGPMGIVTFQLRLQSTRILFKSPDFGKGIKHLFRSLVNGTVLKD